jgi:hypothetical protein
LFGGIFPSPCVDSGDVALGLRIALLQVGLEHAQPGAELFEVLFGVLDGQTLGDAVLDNALLRVDLCLELFYAGAVPSLDTVKRANFDKPSALIDLDHTEAAIAQRDTLRLARPVLRRVLSRAHVLSFDMSR